MPKARLSDEEIAEIEAVNKEQARSLDAAMSNMRAGVPGAVRRGRPTNEERLQRVREAGVNIAPAAARAVEPAVTSSRPDPLPSWASIPKPRNDGGTTLRSARYEIDDDVPIPAKPALNGRTYPWDKLAVGQSFFIEEDGRKNRGKLTSIYSAHKRFPGRRFRAEWTDKDVKRGVAGFRVWRVS